MPRSSSRLAGLSPGVPVVPKRASPATQAGRKRGAKVPRLSQLSDEELMSGAALSLSTLVDRLGYDAVAAALRHHAPAAPGVGGVPLMSVQSVSLRKHSNLMLLYSSFCDWGVNTWMHKHSQQNKLQCPWAPSHVV
jgi:hypothetical protein